MFNFWLLELVLLKMQNAAEEFYFGIGYGTLMVVKNEKTL